MNPKLLGAMILAGAVWYGSQKEPLPPAKPQPIQPAPIKPEPAKPAPKPKPRPSP